MIPCLLMYIVGYTVDTLQYGWLLNPVDIDASVQVSQFTLVRHEQHDCSQNYTAGLSICFRQKVHKVCKTRKGAGRPPVAPLILGFHYRPAPGTHLALAIGQSAAELSRLNRFQYVNTVIPPTERRGTRPSGWHLCVRL